MRRFFLSLISLLIGIVLFIWVIKFIGWEKIKISFSVFKWWEGFLILLLTFSLLLTSMWKWKEVLKGMGVNLPFFSFFQPFFAGYSIIYLAPMVMFGGETFRIYFLKEKNSVPLEKGAASVIVDRVLDITTNLLIVVLGMGFFIFRIGLLPKNWTIFLGGSFLFWLAGITFFYFKTFKKESMVWTFLRLIKIGENDQKPFQFEKEIFEYFRLKKAAFWKGLGLAFLEEIIIFLRTSLLVFFLMKKVDSISILAIEGFTYLITMVPIPASLGTHEAIQAFAFNSLGYGAGTGATFTLILRGTELVFVFLGLVILYKIGLTLVKRLFKIE
jgi:uncharacterized protein (TIRG00374 family)